MRPSSPQDKKRLSYHRDRRNCYGENSKSSRKNIRRHKVMVTRNNRRQARQELLQTDLESGEPLHPRQFPRRWRKRPDQPLLKHLYGRLKRRVRLGMMSPATAEALLSRIQSAATLRQEQPTDPPAVE